jgi:hypothetical protein
MLMIKENLKEYTKSGVSQWLSLDVDEMKGYLRRCSRRSEVTSSRRSTSSWLSSCIPDKE